MVPSLIGSEHGRPERRVVAQVTAADFPRPPRGPLCRGLRTAHGPMARHVDTDPPGEYVAHGGRYPVADRRAGLVLLGRQALVSGCAARGERRSDQCRGWKGARTGAHRVHPQKRDQRRRALAAPGRGRQVGRGHRHPSRWCGRAANVVTRTTGPTGPRLTCLSSRWRCRPARAWR